MTKIDLEKERRWAKLILASQDMLQVCELIERIPPDRSDKDLALDSIGIVTAYCRPFKRKKAKHPAVGEPLLGVLDPGELELHEHVVRMRDKYIVHSDFVDERVQVKIVGHALWVRPGVNPEDASADNRGLSFDHVQQATSHVLARDEFPRILAMATKLREAIKERGRQLDNAILSARHAAGYEGWFRLGNTHSSATGTTR